MQKGAIPLNKITSATAGNSSMNINTGSSVENDGIFYSSVEVKNPDSPIKNKTNSDLANRESLGQRRLSDLDRSQIFEKAHNLMAPMQKYAFEMKGALIATGLAATCYLLFWFEAVLVPFFLAIFLMYLVDPIVETLDVSPRYFCCVCTQHGRRARRTSRGCSRAFASLCAVAIVGFIFALVGYVTALSINQLDVPAYSKQYGVLMVDIETVAGHIGVNFNTTEIKKRLNGNIEHFLQEGLTYILNLVSTLCVTLIYLTYFLCTRVRPSHAGGVWTKIDEDIQRFVTLKCYLSLFVAILVTIVYVFLNVGLAVVWGVITFILNWIPNVGAMVASILPVFIIILSPTEIMNPYQKILAMVLPMCFHFFVGNFIEPKVFGRRLEMDPVVVILSLSMWGLLWGMVGMMLSVPLTASFKIMLSQLHIWPEVVALMEGRYFLSQHNNLSDLDCDLDVRTDVLYDDEVIASH